MLVSSFSKRLKQAMQTRNITATEVVKKSQELFKLGKINKPLNKPLMTNYLKGNYEAKQDNLHALSQILDFDEAYLMGFDILPNENNLKPNNKYLRIPVLGSIPAGIPIEMVEDIIDYEDISEDLLKGDKEYFALKIKGDSMLPNYLEGDILIILKQNDCENGDDCIIAVNGYDATFKRVIKQNDGITLMPLNTKYSPIFYSNSDINNLPVKILGIVKQIRRNL